MSIKLSIIIPCFNCERTLKEAFNSCYTQSLSDEDFEIVMVDDGSTDGTRAMMESLARTKPNVRLFYHEYNRGGGAARNTGISAARGSFIFCLDSDNFFPAATLPKLLATQKKYQCDGVAISERRFFYDNNPKKYRSHFNQTVDRSIVINDIFILDNGGTLLDNFLYTKSAYKASGGYPEHHGFDTQCFELRFLSKNLSVRVAPETVFYHRQSIIGNSYFDRVYKEGLFSRNFYLICEDIMHLLSYSTRELIMNFDVFSHTKLGTENFKARLDIKYKANPSDFFAQTYQAYSTLNGVAQFMHDTAESNAPADVFSRAVIHYKNKDFTKAFADLQRLLTQGVQTKLVYYALLRTGVALSGSCPPIQVENETQKLLKTLAPATQPVGSRSPAINTLKAIVRCLLRR